MDAHRHAQHWLMLVFYGPKAPIRWRGLLVALMLLVCWLAFDPTPRAPALGHQDKWLHLLAFVPLGFAALWAISSDALPGTAWRPFVSAGLAMLGFGVFIEVGQAFIPARSASLADVLADALGIALGLLLAWAVGRMLAATWPSTGR